MSFISYANLVTDLREALEVVNALRVNIARKAVTPTDELNAAAQNIAASIPTLGTSENELAMEPRVMPIYENVAVTIHAARGEGNVFVTAVDPARVHIVDGASRTTPRGGTVHTLRMLAPTASVMVNFVADDETIVREFQLESV